ncbi:L-lysine 2,3-aminomutase [Hydrogenivirga caldilitoris]|uniref:L-lysine 2,3-aminomutase n=1 Tax=Hydrogenivirga caldilitoris TaxID=246264 RepID=A0A497XTU0_9AQUI|nr:KamA family radical SAM protein [Hydrogenivirga caldilitoris]RLJ71600.1 L-lysine 2,3-aminomutase [Hydrogenivirga caldilitoris]
MNKKVKYIIKLESIPELKEQEKKELAKVTSKFAFRTNDYYNSLINWEDPEDPIRRIVIPTTEELDVWGRLDASNESKYMKVHGLEHKYPDTALLLVTDVCGIYCRFCFRKRLFMNDNDEVARDVSEGIEYIRNHPEINNVLLTGGDPLVLATFKLEKTLKSLADIPHVRIVRIGSKMLAANPFRVLNDSSLLKLFEWFNTETGKKLYLMNHFNHPRELTREAKEAVSLIQKTGTTLTNQTPILRGINDAPEVLRDLLEELSFIGVPPYYVFQCRPTAGNKTYSTKIEETIDLVETVRAKVSGLAARVRYVMSHETGKIEILGKTEEFVFFRYHRSADPENAGRFLIFRRNPEAYWFDDYTELVDEYKAELEEEYSF